MNKWTLANDKSVKVEVKCFISLKTHSGYCTSSLLCGSEWQSWNQRVILVLTRTMTDRTCAVVLYKYLTHFDSHSRSISHLISSHHQVQDNISEHATLSSTPLLHWWPRRDPLGYYIGARGTRVNTTPPSTPDYVSRRVFTLPLIPHSSPTWPPRSWFLSRLHASLNSTPQVAAHAAPPVSTLSNTLQLHSRLFYVIVCR